MSANEDRHTMALWVIVWLGCVTGGLALGAILMPLPDMVAGIAKVMLALMVLLAMIIIGIGVWRLSALLRQRPVLVPVIVGFAAVILAVGLGVWVTGTQSADDPNPLKIARVLGSGLGFAVALGAVAHAAVRLIGPRRVGRGDLRRA